MHHRHLVMLHSSKDDACLLSTNGKRLHQPNHCRKGVQAAYCNGFHDKYNCQRWTSRTSHTGMLPLDHCNLHYANSHINEANHCNQAFKFILKWIWHVIFTARRVRIARTMPWQDVCPSIHPSHAGTVSERSHISSMFFHHRVATPF